MGPRLCSRGNDGGNSELHGEIVLQWGHDFAAVEILAPRPGVARRSRTLQWGHDFAAVEI